MSLRGVWSEQDDPYAPNGAWRDCAVSSYLMLLVHAGVDMASIGGAYTVKAREAFENADGLPESQQEQGWVTYAPGDHAAAALFDVIAHDASETQLAGLLNTPGVLVALSGQGTGLLSGFTGAHSIVVGCIEPGKPLGLWDPLEGMLASSKRIAAATILEWHRRLPNDIRWTRENEFAQEPDSMEAIILDPAQAIGDLTLTAPHYVHDYVDGKDHGPYPADTVWPVFGIVPAFKGSGAEPTKHYMVQPPDLGHMCLFGAFGGDYKPRTPAPTNNASHVAAAHVQLLNAIAALEAADNEIEVIS